MQISPLRIHLNVKTLLGFLQQRTWVYWAYFIILITGAPSMLWLLLDRREASALAIVLGMFVAGAIVFLVRLKQLSSYDPEFFQKRN
jgi:uncharacterized SAM-binding protein YcdF (DUF218 family)